MYLFNSNNNLITVVSYVIGFIYILARKTLIQTIYDQISVLLEYTKSVPSQITQQLKYFCFEKLF